MFVARKHEPERVAAAMPGPRSPGNKARRITTALGVGRTRFDVLTVRNNIITLCAREPESADKYLCSAFVGAAEECAAKRVRVLRAYQTTRAPSINQT